MVAIPIPVFILKTTDNSFVLNNILPGKESDIREVFAIRKNKDACRVNPSDSIKDLSNFKKFCSWFYFLSLFYKDFEAFTIQTHGI